MIVDMSRSRRQGISEGQQAPAMCTMAIEGSKGLGNDCQWSSRGDQAGEAAPEARGNRPVWGPPLWRAFFAWSDAVPRYVMDLFGGNRLLVTRAFDASDDAEAVANAKAMFFGDAVGRPEITSYRLRNPFPGADRIFHRGHKCDYAKMTSEEPIAYP